MKKIYTIALLVFLTAIAAQAQHRPPFSEEDRQRFRNEVRQYKHEFLIKELELSKEQQRDFFAAYDEMEDKIDLVASDTRRLEKTVAEKNDATDIELEAAARAVFSQKKSEGEIEATYYERFRQILKPRQLLALRSAERRFAQQLMRHHRKARSAAGSDRP